MAKASARSVEQIVSVAIPLPKWSASSFSFGGIEVEGEEVTREIEEVAAVVSVPDAGDHVVEHDLEIFGREGRSGRQMPDVQVHVLQQRRGDHAPLDQGLDDQEPRLAARTAAGSRRAGSG